MQPRLNLVSVFIVYKCSSIRILAFLLTGCYFSDQPFQGQRINFYQNELL